MVGGLSHISRLNSAGVIEGVQIAKPAAVKPALVSGVIWVVGIVSSAGGLLHRTRSPGTSVSRFSPHTIRVRPRWFCAIACPSVQLSPTLNQTGFGSGSGVKSNSGVTDSGAVIAVALVFLGSRAIASLKVNSATVAVLLRSSQCL